ncbi:hypothetical protein RRG08_007170 [Elysia crispata]|uniref:PiggyBac transposable element-derived protein domain-containing protein n=1 Tax=Elysia crispata TaxID=231223 RepID=A0AAE1E2W9_9GAST|nr:hypothetical protein RRG08_007170 [Elysia crispata]
MIENIGNDSDGLLSDDDASFSSESSTSQTSLIDSNNNYAAELCAKNRPARRYSVFLDFQPVSRDEFLRFLAVLMARGLNPRYSIRSYWSHAPYECTPWYSQTMPPKRLRQFTTHFSTQLGQTQRATRKLSPSSTSSQFHSKEPTIQIMKFQ